MNAASIIRFFIIAGVIGYCAIRAQDDAQAQREAAAGSAVVVVPAAPVNAADEYRELFAALKSAAIAAGDPDVKGFVAGGGVDPQSPAARFVRASRDLVDRVVNASEIDRCNWGVDYSQGPMAMLPHLPDMRQTSTILIADSRIRQGEGDADGAARSLAAVYRLARHANGERGFVITSLVSAAIAAPANEEVNRLLDRGGLDKAQRAVVLAAVAPFDAKDPHEVRAGLVTERDTFIDWMRRTYQPGQPPSGDLREIVSMLGQQSSSDSKKMLAIMDRGESIEPYLILLKGGYDAALAAWDSVRAGAALQAVAEDAQRGKYGPLAAIALPNMTKAREASDKSVAAMALIRKRLSH